MLSARVALVTGGSRGIGRAAAIALARAGASVVVNYLTNEAAANEVVGEISAMGRECMAARADVSVFREAQELVRSVVARFGRLDILVNNAGITQPEPFSETTEAKWDRMIEVNLKSVFNCCKAAVPHMERQEWGRIINMSSVVAKSGGIGAGVHYCAAKAGVLGLTKALASQLAARGITVNAIAPAMIDTEMIRWRPPELLERHLSLIPAGRLGHVDEVAGVVVYLASEEASFVTGATIDVNGGMYMD